jgi:hypothetical protein
LCIIDNKKIPRLIEFVKQNLKPLKNSYIFLGPHVEIPQIRGYNDPMIFERGFYEYGIFLLCATVFPTESADGDRLAG